MDLKKENENFLFLDEYDDVLDVINEFPEEMRDSCLKFLSHEPDKGSNFVFLLPDRGYGVIIKLVAKGDEGLVFLGADSGRTIVEKLEMARDNAPISERHKMDGIVNQVRYSVALISQELDRMEKEEKAKARKISPEAKPLEDNKEGETNDSAV